jgi:hypothetical protein
VHDVHLASRQASSDARRLIEGVAARVRIGEVDANDQ